MENPVNADAHSRQLLHIGRQLRAHWGQSLRRLRPQRQRHPPRVAPASVSAAASFAINRPPDFGLDAIVGGQALQIDRPPRPVPAFSRLSARYAAGAVAIISSGAYVPGQQQRLSSSHRGAACFVSASACIILATCAALIRSQSTACSKTRRRRASGARSTIAAINSSSVHPTFATGGLVIAGFLPVFNKVKLHGNASDHCLPARHQQVLARDERGIRTGQHQRRPGDIIRRRQPPQRRARHERLPNPVVGVGDQIGVRH